MERLLHVLEWHFKAKPVVLIDEYDAPLTYLLGRDMDLKPFILVLRELFSLFKHLETIFTSYSSRASAALPT